MMTLLVVLLLVNPLAPTMVGFTDAGDAYVVLAWDPNSETDLSRYNVRMSTMAGNYTNSTAIVVSPSATPTYRYENLPVGMKLYFTVTAVNTTGLESGYSNEVSVLLGGPRGPAGPPGPAGSSLTVQGPVISDLTSVSVRLSWKTASERKSRIEFTYAGGTFSSVVVSGDPVTDHYIRLTDLRPATKYTYEVFNEDAQGGVEKASGSFRTK